MNLDAPDQVIGLHVGNPMLALRPEFAPKGNSVAYVLLHRMLELALLRDGLTRDGCCGGCGAELNDCIFMGAVTDPVAAAETIKLELSCLSLLPHCQIGISEGPGWRCVYPSPEVRMEWLMDTERLEHASAQYILAQSNQLNAIREAVRRLALKSGQPGEKR
jgi:hypothetical protein